MAYTDHLKTAGSALKRWFIATLYDAAAVAAMWLVGSEPLLGGARPIDVLAQQGASPVIRAIDGISQGAFA